MVNRIDARKTREQVEREGAIVIDVLGPDSYRRQHLPHAINIPVDAPDFEARVQRAVPNKDQPIVVYCASETCESSPTAAKKLEAMGYTNVSDFEAGLEGWRHAGFAFEEPAASAA